VGDMLWIFFEIGLDLTRSGLEIRNDHMRRSHFISMTTAIPIAILGNYQMTIREYYQIWMF